ncbi:TetR/AcrR family transcriptional regulator [Actinocrispum wychmicini]|nr:TetR/AcrR family transcriptional regulator [Actinocrispum wychmicini]
MVGTRGRPRSEEARIAILKTALRLCERDGYQQVTIKAIADEAGVGRQTVYRWWPDKTEVVLDALLDLTERELPQMFHETGDTLRDVEAILRLTFDYSQRITGRALVGVMADAQSDPELSKRLQGMVIGPRRAALRDILRRGVEAGTLAESVPLSLVVDFAWGTMWYRLLSRHAPINAALAKEITDAVALMLSPGTLDH